MIAQLVVTVTVAAFVGAVAYAALRDLTTYTIPNRVGLALIAAFVVYAPASGLPLETLAWHLAAFAIVLVGAFAMFAFGWIGGGDAKLAAAVALWMGWTAMPVFLVYSALFGGALTLALLMARTLPLPMMLVRVGWVSRLHDRASGIPYGIALAAGALCALPLTPAWRTVLGG